MSRPGGLYLGAVISRDVAEAELLVSTGATVVLIVAPVDQVVCPPPAPGRLAVMVGDPGDPHVQRAAAEMAAELFGA